MLRLVAIVGTVPVVGVATGYWMRSTQASENKQEGNSVFRSCDIPIYSTVHATSQEEDKPVYPRNAVEQQIGDIRKSVQAFLSQYKESYNKVKTTVNTGYEHTAATFDNIQNNPSEVPRVMLITLAGFGGIILGYRGGILRKLTYGTIAGTSAAALAYPAVAVGVSKDVANEVKGLWKQSGGEDLVNQYWPFSKEEKKEDQENKQV